MKIFKSKHNLQKEIKTIKNISFIPTMGGLHKGHISLIKKAKRFNGSLLVSIFVNPAQFNEKKDFVGYPRNVKKDLLILKRLKVDLVFLPSKNQIFNFIPKKKVFIDKFSKRLCGKSRKGHFEGVLNVVNRFLEIIDPKYLFLGKKDFQQLYLISKHIKTKKIRTKVIPCETTREFNGVACSTRNKNLTKKQFTVASKVYNYLKLKKRLLKNNIVEGKKNLYLLGVDKLDYLEILNLSTLNKPKSKKEKFRIFIAYYLGKNRLIDNI